MTSLATNSHELSYNLKMTKRLLDKHSADAAAYKSTCGEQSKRIKTLRGQILNQKTMLKELHIELADYKKHKHKPSLQTVLEQQANTIGSLVDKIKELQESKKEAELQANKWKKAFLAISADADFEN